jgi:hypothetical protein
VITSALHLSKLNEIVFFQVIKDRQKREEDKKKRKELKKAGSGGKNSRKDK